MNKLLKFTFIISFLFGIAPVYSKPSSNINGGQKVEKLKINQTKPFPGEKGNVLHEENFPFLLTRDALASDVVGTRPNEGKGATFVKVSLFIDDIYLIDDAHQTFGAKFLFAARWLDPRLAKGEKEIEQYPLHEVWNPLIRIVNSRSVTTKNPDSVFVDQAGHVIFVQTYSGTFTVPLNLKNFPFDKHEMGIFLRSFYGPDEVKFFIDKKLTGWSSILSIPDWKISNGKANVQSVYSKEQEMKQAQVAFNFDIKRKIFFYLFKIIIPMSLIVLMSWGVFWISPQRLEAQIGLSATAFLTLFAFQFVIASLLPKISYLTRMDRFTMLCSFLVFFALLEAITSSFMARNNRLKEATILDRSCRIIFPAAFGLGIFYAFFW